MGVHLGVPIWLGGSWHPDFLSLTQSLGVAVDHSVRRPCGQLRKRARLKDPHPYVSECRLLMIWLWGTIIGTRRPTGSPTVTVVWSPGGARS